MTAGDLVLVVAAVMCVIAFAALVVVLMRVLDALRDVRREVDQLRAETTPLIQELVVTTEEARATVDEARADLDRFDRVLGSAEAIGDAVGGRVARTSFSAPMIKATGLARGTSRTFSRLRGSSKRTTREIDALGPVTPVRALDVDTATATKRRKRA